MLDKRWVAEVRITGEKFMRVYEDIPGKNQAEALTEVKSRMSQNDLALKHSIYLRRGPSA